MRFPVLLVVLLLAMALLGADRSEPHIQAAANAFHAGKAEAAEGKLDAAITSFQNAIDIEPTFTEARKALIQANIDAGHKLDAARALSQLLEIEPGDFNDRILLGQLLLDQQQPERALAQFSEALKLVPKNADALLGFAQAAAKAGMEDRAREALDRGRKLYPSDRRFMSTH